VQLDVRGHGGGRVSLLQRGLGLLELLPEPLQRCGRDPRGRVLEGIALQRFAQVEALLNVLSRKPADARTHVGEGFDQTTLLQTDQGFADGGGR